MTKDEARHIYMEASAICTSDEEAKKICEEKEVPGPWIAEFIEQEDNGELLTE